MHVEVEMSQTQRTSSPFLSICLPRASRYGTSYHESRTLSIENEEETRIPFWSLESSYRMGLLELLL